MKRSLQWSGCLVQRLIILIGFAIALPATCLGQTTVWSEDWEGDWLRDWHVDAGTWEVGTPTSGPGSAFADDNVAATVLAGNYSEPVDTRLVRHAPFVVPPVSENPRLRFWHWFSFSQLDNGEVQISPDGGTTWETISTTYFNTSSNTWTYTLIDLSAYAGQNVQLAFDFHGQCNGFCDDVSSGWYIDEVEVLTGPIVFNSPESFELGLGDWAVERGTWEVGTPTSGPGGCHEGQICAATMLTGNYGEPVDTRLISPPFVVPTASQNPALRFWHWFSFSQLDNGEVQISPDGGATWETISNTFVGTSSNAWTPFFVSLSAYAGQNVQLAFDFHGQCNGFCDDVSSGWYIDEVTIDGFTDSGGASISASPSNIDFGDVGVGGAATAELTISHTGTDDVNVTSIALTGTDAAQFNVDATPFFLAPGASKALTVGFTPQQVGEFRAALAFASDLGTVTVNLSGRASSGVDTEEAAVPTAFVLHGAYPNPFNPATTIRFDLPEPAAVTLQVFDLLGREAQHLGAGHFPPGRHQEILVVADELASGVYFYRLVIQTAHNTDARAGSFTIVK